MKLYLTALLLLVLAVPQVYGQKTIRDNAIRYQQERMVFKQWDRNKFVPEPGFLHLNPMYWLTWGLHPNYPKTDLRPLGPYGPQTQRMGMVLSMQQSSNAYKLHADTLRSVALTEISNYAGAITQAPTGKMPRNNSLKPVNSMTDPKLVNQPDTSATEQPSAVNSEDNLQNSETSSTENTNIQKKLST
ncbi:MAG: hypothetical protein EOO88_61960 [Pedobacter sp.]|nr:MAG: hypothetical protein EOO88_61960 [Pedobacter sp.]